MPRFRFGRNMRRTHRKVLVVDGNLGFTGGVGIAEEWCGDARDETEWRDSHFRVTGPSVRGLRAAFYGNWAEAVAEDEGAAGLAEALAPGDDLHPCPGEVQVQVVRSSASYSWSDVAAMTEVAIAAARHRLRIGTAYFTPDDATTRGLIAASRRGVQVEIMLPWRHMDNRVSQLAGAEAITPLLKAGVAFHVFQPTMYHAKLMLLDDRVSIIGSANFNRRSAWQDEEVCMVCVDRDLAATLSDDWDADMARCRPIELARWRRRGTWQRMQEAAARLIKPAV
jgi:cardiolipin synthase